MEQQRRIGLAHQSISTAPGSSSTSTSSLLGIGEELYELLQGGGGSTTTSRAKTCSSVFFDQVPKMEPDQLVGDFMGCSYTWGQPPQQQQQQQQLLYTTDSLAACYNQQLPEQQQQQQQFAYGGSANAAVASPQIQALRDFMVYGSQPAVPALPAMTSFSSAVSSRATTPVGVAGFYQGLEDVTGVVDASGLQVAGGAPKAQDMSLAYRALCSEIYATERSPHRSQFQRENHILAERQRREEMNEKFSALRAMIPKATKKDKASIVGDTIDYVLELEKRLKQLQACKDTASGVTPGVGGGSGTTAASGGTGFFKSLKRKSPYGDGSAAPPPALDSPKPSSSETTLQPASPLRDGRDSAVSSPISDQITADSKLAGKPVKVVGAGVAKVDVQQLGQQAVVKVVCSRQPGHVLRVLNALEECKVEVLQSNVMTVADSSIHFITIQLEEGMSASSEELVSAVLEAINQDQQT